MTELEKAESNIRITHCIQSMRLILEHTDNIQMIDKIISGCGFVITLGKKRKDLIKKKAKQINS